MLYGVPRTGRFIAPVIGFIVGTGVAAPAPAMAQFFFDYGAYNRPYVVKKQKIKRSRPVEAEYDHGGIERGNKTPEKIVDRTPQGPLVITVSLRRQRVTVWDQHGLMMEAPISSGKLGTPTPTGVFAILEKNRVHYSNLYDSAPMPNMQRLTWSGVALHAGALPGYPASHGCIRLPHGFSKRLFEVTRLGTRVIVAYDPVQPRIIDDPQLFAAYPEDIEALHAMLPGETRVADASDAGRLPSAEVGSVIGVSTALASEAPASTELMLNYRAERKAEMARLQAAVAAAKDEKARAVAAAAEIVKSSEGRKLAVREARIEVNRLAAEARKAEQAAQLANDKLDRFSKSLIIKTGFTPEDVTRASDDEDRLENAALDSADAAAAAVAALAKGNADLADAEKALADADAVRVKAVNDARSADDKLADALEAEAAAKRRDAKRKEPVHVFISRKTQKLYVRQGYEPILEVPVAIDRPDEPLGTHVFTALDVGSSTNAVTWSVATIPAHAPAKSVVSKKERGQGAESAPTTPAAATASLALQRITIPTDVRLKIEDVMKPGSSLIISDNGLSNETGKFTDFIVPLR